MNEEFNDKIKNIFNKSINKFNQRTENMINQMNNNKVGLRMRKILPFEGRPNRNEVIGKDDIINLQISLGLNKDVMEIANEF